LCTCAYAIFYALKTRFIITYFSSILLDPNYSLDFIQSFSVLYIGITTLVGGGTGPADGTRATTCTPAPNQMKLMLQSTDDMPLNFGFTGKVCFLSFVLFTYNACFV